jgi:hypothetical protein
MDDKYSTGSQAFNPLLSLFKRLLFLSFAIMSISQTIAVAQTKKELKEIESSIEELRLAMVDGNKADLERLSAVELSYGHSNGHVENQAEFVGNIVSGKSDFVSISLSNQTIQIVENTAIVRHDLQAETNNDGKPGTVSLHVLSVWLKQKGKWKMLARQAVKVAH